MVDSANSRLDVSFSPSGANFSSVFPIWTATFLKFLSTGGTSSADFPDVLGIAEDERIAFSYTYTPAFPRQSNCNLERYPVAHRHPPDVRGDTLSRSSKYIEQISTRFSGREKCAQRRQTARGLCRIIVCIFETRRLALSIFRSLVRSFVRPFLRIAERESFYRFYNASRGVHMYISNTRKAHGRVIVIVDVTYGQVFYSIFGVSSDAHRRTMKQRPSLFINDDKRAKVRAHLRNKYVVAASRKNHNPVQMLISRLRNQERR